MLIAFKLKLLLACAAGLVGPLAVAPIMSDLSARDHILPEQAIVELKSGHFAYRVAGDFTRAGKPAEAPLAQLSFAGPLTIMKRQVSSAEYQACVDDGGCRALDRDVVVAIDRPAVQVSWHDAEAYANWLSRKTGETYRLPTDEEWAFAAGSKFADDGVPVDDNNPAKRWIARYERETGRDADTATRAFGAFGTNENGLSDLSGNVWEWTATCFVRSTLDESGRIVGQSKNCGVRIAEGRTAPMSRTSSATRAPAVALRALPLTISAFGLSANGRPGRARSACASARHSRSRRPELSPFNCAWCRRPARMCRFRRYCAGTDFALS